MFGKGEENGVSTPHVLCMRPYAHIISKYAKRDFYSKHLILLAKNSHA